jgi:hypothetical protein
MYLLILPLEYEADIQPANLSGIAYYLVPYGKPNFILPYAN